MLGTALAQGGPASMLIAYILVGSMLYTVVNSLCELVVLYPVQGSFNNYGSRFIDPAWVLIMHMIIYFVNTPIGICNGVELRFAMVDYTTNRAECSCK